MMANMLAHRVAIVAVAVAVAIAAAAAVVLLCLPWQKAQAGKQIYVPC